MKSLFRFVSSVMESNVHKLKRPYKLNFCVTYRCQSKCLTCDIWNMKPEGELSLEEIRRFAENNPYLDWVQLTGGEPFLRRDIPDIVKCFMDNSDPYIISIPTNSLCAPEYIERQVKAISGLGLHRFALTLSLDGPKATHDRIRGREGNFESVMALYGVLEPFFRDRKDWMLVFGYTMSKFNAGELAETVQEVKKRYPLVSYDDFHLNVAQNSPNYYRNQGESIAPDPKTTASEIRSHLLRKNASGAWPFVENRYLKGLIHFMETGECPLPSREGEVSVFMDSWGEVYPSIMSDSKMGNVKDFDYSLEKLLASAKDPIPSWHWTSCEAYQTVLGSLF